MVFKDSCAFAAEIQLFKKFSKSSIWLIRKLQKLSYKDVSIKYSRRRRIFDEWLHVLGILGRVLIRRLSGPLSGTITKMAHRVSGKDLQIRHAKLELYRLSIGFGSAPRRFGGEPASIPMCSHLFLRVESTHNVNSSAPPGPAGPVLVVVYFQLETLC